MPQYILREFKVTDARVSVGRDRWEILESWSCCSDPHDLDRASLVGGRSKGPGVGISSGGWVVKVAQSLQHQTGGREHCVPVLIPQCPPGSMCGTPR